MGPQQHERSAVGNSWQIRQELTRQQRGRRAGSRALFLHPRRALALPAPCSRILNPLPPQNAELESLPHCSTRFCDPRCSSALRGVGFAGGGIVRNPPDTAWLRGPSPVLGLPVQAPPGSIPPALAVPRWAGKWLCKCPAPVAGDTRVASSGAYPGKHPCVGALHGSCVTREGASTSLRLSPPAGGFADGAGSTWLQPACCPEGLKWLLEGPWRC